MSPVNNKFSLKANIANWFTLGNAVCGFFAIVCASHGNILPALGLLILGMVFDGLDGRVARATGTTSPLGAQLDSLSDAISFGLAPAFLMSTVCAAHMPAWLIWGAGGLYVACAVYRLARFNVETVDDSEDSHLWFTGLPSTMAAAVVCLTVLVFTFASASVQPWLAAALIPLTMYMGVMMASRIPVPHINYFVRLLKTRK